MPFMLIFQGFRSSRYGEINVSLYDFAKEKSYDQMRIYTRREF